MTDPRIAQLTQDELVKIPLKDLLALQELLSKAIANRREQEKLALYEKITALALESGFSLDELLNPKQASKKAPPKVRYRNPNNKDETWTGKGRKPKWLLELLDAGRQLDEFAV